MFTFLAIARGVAKGSARQTSNRYANDRFLKQSEIWQQSVSKRDSMQYHLKLSQMANKLYGDTIPFKEAMDRVKEMVEAGQISLDDI